MSPGAVTCCRAYASLDPSQGKNLTLVKPPLMQGGLETCPEVRYQSKDIAAYAAVGCHCCWTAYDDQAGQQTELIRSRSH